MATLAWTLYALVMDNVLSGIFLWHMWRFRERMLARVPRFGGEEGLEAIAMAIHPAAEAAKTQAREHKRSLWKKVVLALVALCLTTWTFFILIFISSIVYAQDAIMRTVLFRVGYGFTPLEFAGGLVFIYSIRSLFADLGAGGANAQSSPALSHAFGPGSPGCSPGSNAAATLYIGSEDGDGAGAKQLMIDPSFPTSKDKVRSSFTPEQENWPGRWAWWQRMSRPASWMSIFTQRRESSLPLGTNMPSSPQARSPGPPSPEHFPGSQRDNAMLVPRSSSLLYLQRATEGGEDLHAKPLPLILSTYPTPPMAGADLKMKYHHPSAAVHRNFMASEVPQSPTQDSTLTRNWGTLASRHASFDGVGLHEDPFPQETRVLHYPGLFLPSEGSVGAGVLDFDYPFPDVFPSSASSSPASSWFSHPVVATELPGVLTREQPSPYYSPSHAVLPHEGDWWQPSSLDRIMQISPTTPVVEDMSSHRMACIITPSVYPNSPTSPRERAVLTPLYGHAAPLRSIVTT
jgi:hypothetical protein